MPEALPYKQFPILFVDDEENALLALKNLFKREFTLYTARDAKEALKLIEEHPEMALIVSDQRMPGLSGIELLKRVSQNRPDMTRMLITAYSEMELVIDAINKGNVYRYISKPYNEDELKQILMQGIERFYLIKERDRLYAEKIETLKKIARTNRLTAIGILSAGMAHEINNPLVAIKTFLDMIPGKYEEESKDGEFWESFYRVAVGETQRIQQLISHLLHYSKAPEEEGLKLERIDVNTLLSETVTFLDNEAKKKGLTIRQEFDPALPPCAVDPEKIRQVFLNLLLNAIQATSEGYILIKTSFDAGAAELPFFHVSFKDTGMGISEENLQKLFNPFFTTKRDEGTGLGLMMCQHIIDEHRGSIDVKSELGKGTTMTVRLPLNPAQYNRRKSDRKKNLILR
ncbi:MAG TPA: ATP-binding protein [Candidatus Manganitrophaceae bacterium]|nr:ATP-binding protein [Candidatus Manganitrophaceae bacterium]